MYPTFTKVTVIFKTNILNSNNCVGLLSQNADSVTHIPYILKDVRTNTDNMGICISGWGTVIIYAHQK